MSADEESSTDYSSEDEKGDRISEAQEILLAEAFLAARANDKSKLQNVKDQFAKVGTELQVPERQPKDRITLKDLPDAPGDDDVEADIPEELHPPDVAERNKALAALAQLSDDDEPGLVEVAPTSREELPEKAVAALDRAFGREGLAEEEAFLKDYFLKQRWREDAPAVSHAESTPAVPAGESVRVAQLDISDEADAEALLQADRFEAKYNFRFEEKGGTKVAGHARDLTDGFSVLRPESKRARKRREERERKALELAKQSEATAKRDDSEDFPSDQEWFMCDSCLKPIPPGKVRFDCTVCEDFSVCKACQKSTKHEHSLRKTKVPSECVPPKQWKAAVTSKEDDEETDLAKEILSKLTYKPDPGFRYVECPPVDFGLTDQELLSVDDSVINAVAPISALDLWNENADKLIQRGRAKAEALRAKNKGVLPLAANDPKEGPAAKREEAGKPKAKKIKGIKPQTISKRRLQAYGIDFREKKRKKKETAAAE